MHTIFKIFCFFTSEIVERFREPSHKLYELRLCLFLTVRLLSFHGDACQQKSKVKLNCEKKCIVNRILKFSTLKRMLKALVRF